MCITIVAILRSDAMKMFFEQYFRSGFSFDPEKKNVNAIFNSILETWKPFFLFRAFETKRGNNVLWLKRVSDTFFPSQHLSVWCHSIETSWENQGDQEHNTSATAYVHLHRPQNLSLTLFFMAFSCMF